MASPRKGAERWIRPLPERLINKIAAGEVVERPASVVKELVENSLDANATRIEIAIDKAGTKLIRITDNGCGIPSEQIEIAFSRHATSKISDFKDLDSVLTYGFRGEALPSIASVSRLRIVSRPESEDAATELVIEGGVLQSRRPLAAPFGTTIEVENLFYNTPARRKFLKAETTELRHLSRAATALALGRYDVGFTFVSNGRTIFSEPAGTDLGARTTALLAPGKKLIEVRGEMSPVEVFGYICPPDLAQRNRNNQYIFINKRIVQAPTLSHALVAGYGEMMPGGHFPIGVLLLSVDPAEVDVNVHPAKTEVRLSREREIHDALYRLVKNSLQNDGIIPSISLGRIGSDRKMSTHWSPSPSPAASRGRIPGLRDLAVTNQKFLDQLYRQPDSATLPDVSQTEIIRVDKQTGEILDSIDSKPSLDVQHFATSTEPIRLIGRFSDLYLIFQREDTLLIIDQHTAHERVLFEDTMKRIAASSALASQQLLLPVQVDLSVEQFALFDEASEVMNGSGFTIEPFGGRTVRIEAVPAILSRKSPEKVMMQILDDIASLRRTGYDLRKAMAQSIACRSAVMAGDRLSDREAVGLVEALLKCENRYSCPHGRPTFIQLSRADLDKQFGRE